MRFVSFLIAVVLCLVNCESDQASTLPTPPVERWNNTAQVTIEGDLSKLSVLCELALTPQERAKGLMYRKEPLGSEAGMLFIMDTVDEHSFWMRNTYIPLDMVFITEDETVACLVENAVPLTRDSRKCNRPSRYVLEVDAGLCAKHGIRPGQSVKIRIQ